MNSKNIAILDGATLGADMNLSVFEKFGKLKIYHTTEREQVRERIADCDIVILNKIKMDKQVLEGNERLKLICITATGFDNVDIEYCKSKFPYIFF